MYDVAIEVLNLDDLTEVMSSTIQFRMMYVSSTFTEMQIIMRVVFCGISLIVTAIYSFQMLVRIQRPEWD